MECKVLDENDIEQMQNFVDDENTKYEEDFLLNFINEKNAYGFVISQLANAMKNLVQPVKQTMMLYMYIR